MLIIWWPAISETLLLWLSFLLLALALLSKPYPALRLMVWFLAGFVLALLSCQQQLETQITTPQQLSFVGVIDSLPRTTSHKVSFIAQNTSNNQSYALNWYLDHERILPEFSPGQIYEFEVRLKPPNGTANGVGFDREKWLFRNRLDAVGTIKAASLSNKQSHHPKHIINQWRQSISNQIDQHFTTQSSQALIQALSIGNKSHFEHQDFQRFQQTGTAHLIAISGLHIGMVAMSGWLLGSLLFWVWPRQRVNKIQLQVICGLILALLYAGLAGFEVSTQRALIMLGVYAFFKLTHRKSFAWDVWSLSLLIVLILDPLSVLDAGFWLSFTAVAVLIVCFQGLKQHHHKVTQFLIIQWRLLLGMLPLSLLIFSQVNLMTPLVNMVMIPLMTFVIVPLIMLMLLCLTFAGSIPNSLVSMLDYSCQHFLTWLEWLSVHAVVPIQFAIENSWQTTLLLVGIAVLLLPKAIPQRYWGLVPLLLATLQSKEQIAPGHFLARLLDVGQGLAVHIETSNHHLLYDVGAAYDSGFNMADAVLMPYFKQQNINSIDTLILSHQDNDHSGAANFLLQQLDIASVLGTESHHQPCVSGINWQWDGVSFTVLSPFNLTPYLKNNSSCVLKVESSSGFSLLLTGDIETPVEYRLTQMPAESIQSDVLLIPHHGSKTSSTESFIKTVQPHIAINSSGSYNPFNHPASSVVKTYQQLDIPVYDTQSSGMITIASKTGSTVTQFRQTDPRIWRKKSPE